MDQARCSALSISYDEDADVLYVAFGEPAAGVDEEVRDGVYLRSLEDGSAVVGLTVMDFVRRFGQQRALELPVDVFAKAA